jgi:hypothetical protein
MRGAGGLIVHGLEVHTLYQLLSSGISLHRIQQTENVAIIVPRFITVAGIALDHGKQVVDGPLQRILTFARASRAESQPGSLPTRE